MLPDRVSNPGPLTYESGALPIALRGPAPLVRQATELSIILPIKCQTKIAAGDILIFLFYLSKKIRLDFSCESSA